MKHPLNREPLNWAGDRNDSDGIFAFAQDGRGHGRHARCIHLADDAESSLANHFERVAAGMGGISEIQKFLRLYLVPGKAHSSQGRCYTVASASDTSRNATVPLPKLPGGGNQTPSREQDQMFTVLQDWVEKGSTPGSITLASRDDSVSYPICVYPQKAIWNGSGSSKVAASYSCR